MKRSKFEPFGAPDDHNVTDAAGTALLARSP